MLCYVDGDDLTDRDLHILSSRAPSSTSVTESRMVWHSDIGWSSLSWKRVAKWVLSFLRIPAIEKEVLSILKLFLLIFFGSNFFGGTQPNFFRYCYNITVARITKTSYCSMCRRK